MANLLLDAASTLLPKAIDAILPSQDPASTDPPPSTDRTVLSTQDLPTPPPLPLQPSAPLGSNHPGVVLPFQIKINDFTGSIPNSYTQALTSLTKIQTLIKPFRDAKLLHLEAVLYPNAPSYKTPVTVDLAWTPNDVTVANDDIIATPGSARITCGGLHLLQQGIVKCSLGYINPIIKCPIPYTNTPRINYLPHKHPDIATTSTTTLASLIVRGTILLSHPLAIPLP